MKRQKLNGPTLVREASADAAIINEESRLVRLSFSSETPVTRASWFDEPWVEVLGHNDKEVDLERLNGGAPVLYGHNPHDRAAHIGVVERAWLEKGRGYAEVRLSRREDVADIWQDIKDGILRSVSVGYRILERTLVQKNDKGPSEYRVTRWLPMEVSLVPIPADATVGVGRSDDAAGNYTITDLVDNEDRDMTRETETVTPAAELTPNAPAPQNPEVRQEVDLTQVRAEAQQAERQRAAGIHDVVAKAKVKPELAREWVNEGITVDQARERAIDELARADVHHTPRVEVTMDARDKQRQAAQDWLLHRAGERVDGQPMDLTGNAYRGLTMVDIARRALEASGQRTDGMTPMEIAKRAVTQTTSDFPIILENALHKVLLASYSAVPYSWTRFCATGELSDLRPHNRYRMGGFGDLAAVNEAGEFTNGSLSDAEKESITGATKGKILNLSRQLIINDDLGAFLGIARQLGQAAARTVEKDVYALLALNSGLGPTMSDGKTLFHADHGNIGTGGAPSVASFDDARVKMAKQMDVGSNDYIDLRPSVWLGPVELGGTARVTNDAQYDPDTANKLQKPNMVRGLFSDIVDTPRLTGTPWYAFADRNIAPVIEVAFLNGQQTPYLEMQEGFRVDGISWKVRLDYGVGAVGFRGAVRNAGA